MKLWCRIQYCSRASHKTIETRFNCNNFHSFKLYQCAQHHWRLQYAIYVQGLCHKRKVYWYALIENWGNCDNFGAIWSLLQFDIRRHVIVTSMDNCWLSPLLFLLRQICMYLNPLTYLHLTLMVDGFTFHLVVDVTWLVFCAAREWKNYPSSLLPIKKQIHGKPLNVCSNQMWRN